MFKKLSWREKSEVKPCHREDEVAPVVESSMYKNGNLTWQLTKGKHDTWLLTDWKLITSTYGVMKQQKYIRLYTTSTNCRYQKNGQKATSICVHYFQWQRDCHIFNGAGESWKVRHLKLNMKRLLHDVEARRLKTQRLLLKIASPYDMLTTSRETVGLEPTNFLAES